MLADVLDRLPSGEVAVDDRRAPLDGPALRRAVAADRSWLSSHGVERCALAADNGVPWIVGDLALHTSGQVSVPLPPAFTAAQRKHAIDDAGVDALLTDDVTIAGSLAGFAPAGTAPGSRLMLYRRRIEPDERPQLPGGTSKITYTSGSTGAPKGVCLSAAHLETVARSLAEATRTLRLRRHLCVLPLSTLLENVAGVLAPLTVGACCVAPSSSTTGIGLDGVDARKLLGAVAQLQPDSLILVPELLRLLVTAAEQGWSPPDTLRFVAVGGAVVSPALLDRANEVGIPVYEGYGLSECGSVVCLNTPEARRVGSVGRPLPHAGLRIDPTGEIHVTGDTMLGYVGDPPRRPADEFATGDLGRMDAEEFVYVLGRRRNVFITSLGRNVSPEWVEAEIAQQPGVAQVLVHGEARPYPVALVVPTHPDVDAIVIQEAITAANQRLPAYAQVRRWIRVAPFSAEDGLLTANGRLRRAEIERRHASAVEDLFLDAIAS